MATLDTTDDVKRASLVSAKNSLTQLIVMSLIQLGFADPFSVDIDSLEIPESSDTFLVESLQKNINYYNTVCSAIAALG